MSYVRSGTSIGVSSSDGNRIDTPVTVVAVLGILILAAVCFETIDLRQGLLALVGAGFGFVMYQASFSFAGGWRAAVTEGRTANLRAQMVAIAIAGLLMMPLLEQGNILGQPLIGALGPLGISLAVGSLLFGFGMQLGGGCASGTLFTVGGGSFRMLLTLAFFIVGALIGTAHLPWWAAQYSIGVIRPVEFIGLWPTILAQTLGLAAVFLLARRWEKHKRGSVEPIHNPPATSLDMRWSHRVWRGQWPLLWASIALAALSVANLLLAGQPWSVTFAYNLWGAKLAAVFGLDVTQWEYWTWSMPNQALAGPILAESTSVTNFGLILGALLAAGLSKTFAPVTRIPLGSALAAIIGGLLMGYGARLAFGCNVGALFSGIASGSLHGWVWFVLAFIGSLAGIRTRRLFGLEG
ncbi:YeeE/YedE family protein [Pseudomonas fluorescens]|uniref:YeeE/YedE family protein n=1 Tax=Pseudomonas fluorescens TaxID=294 RepID=A0A7M2J668_PSEFL|nr:YeeE/YedE family protein [Pseudomonas fluorescens]QOU04430.1 YeeE/YedE family protein [Pseudomonas fluorescens]